MKKFTIAYLLQQHCKGQLSEEEYTEFQQWLKEDIANRQYAKEMLKIYRTSRAADLYGSISHQQSLNNTMNRVNEIKQSRIRRRWVALAASVAAFAILFGASQLVLEPEKPTVPVVVSPSIEAGNSKATLVLGSGKEVILDELQDSLIETVSGGMIKNKNNLLSYEAQPNNQHEVNTIRTPRGGEYRLVLSDGTKVWLNAESELSYPTSFSGNIREVSLKGEVYMEVAKNPDKPFIVNTSKGKIRVLGTAFNVKNYETDKQLVATLVEGKINLSNAHKSVVLTPSMQACVGEGNSEISVKKVDPALYTAWKDGEFVFRDQSLQEMMELLSRWYDFDYKFENATLKEMRFSADIKRYNDLTELLAVLEKTKDVTFEINQKTLIIR
ncbi:MAG: FecR family protein [Mangrovibacterium sp.]